MRWYFNVRQNEVLVEVEIRPTEDLSTGSISARTRINFEPYRVGPATVRINFRPSDDLFLNEVNHFIEWLQVANLLANQLDHYITTQEDFEKRFEAIQYNPEVWQSCYVYPVEEADMKRES